jgi:hypothetical protein
MITALTVLKLGMSPARMFSGDFFYIRLSAGWGLVWYRNKHHEFDGKVQKEKRKSKMYSGEASSHYDDKPYESSVVKPTSRALSYA